MLSLGLVCHSQWTYEGSCWNHCSGMIAGAWCHTVPVEVKADVPDVSQLSGRGQSGMVFPMGRVLGCV